jgi:hypothetical protein
MQESAKFVAILVGKRSLCRLFVHLGTLEQEVQLVDIYFLGEIVYSFESQHRSRLSALSRSEGWGGRSGVIHEMGMLVLDGGVGGKVATCHLSMDIEHARCIVVDLYIHRDSLHILFGVFYSLRGSITQDLKHILGAAHRGTQGNSNRQTGHACVRNTYGECILIDILGE